jgi:hypothetical protein
MSVASEKCHQEKRKTVNGEDIIFAMTSLGFENYAEVLKIYLAKYRQVVIFLFWKVELTTFRLVKMLDRLQEEEREEVWLLTMIV